MGSKQALKWSMHLAGHADATGLETWLLSNDTPGQVILNHGEPDAREALAARLTDKGCTIRTTIGRRDLRGMKRAAT